MCINCTIVILNSSSEWPSSKWVCCVFLFVEILLFSHFISSSNTQICHSFSGHFFCSEDLFLLFTIALCISNNKLFISRSRIARSLSNALSTLFCCLKSTDYIKPSDLLKSVRCMVPRCVSFYSSTKKISLNRQQGWVVKKELNEFKESEIATDR